MANTQRKKPQQWRVVPNFGGHRDHAGKAAWRARKPATGELMIPLNLLPNAKEYQGIANSHNVFIFSSAPIHNNGRLFELWGTPPNTEAARREIIQWITNASHAVKQKRDKSFARVVSLTDNQRAKAEKKWEDDVRREGFRQNPSEVMRFDAVGSFHWPIDKWPAKEMLGGSYEALDPIRMDCSCYIVYDADRDLFRVMGKFDDVQEGLQRLRVTCWQITATMTAGVRKNYIHWLPNESQKMEIMMVECESTMSNHTNIDERSLRGTGHGRRSPSTTAEETASTHADFKTNVMQRLRNLRYYRGEIELILHFGTFKVTSSSEQLHLNMSQCTVSEYKDMSSHDKFNGKVTEEIGDLAIEASAWSALKKSGLIVPLGQTESLEHTEPVYVGHFAFAEGDKKQNRLCLSVAWQKTGDAYGDDDFDMISQKWTRYEGSTPYSTLDASMTNLNTGFAWMFDLNIAEYVDESRLHEQYKSFAKSLKFDARAAQKEKLDEPFFKHNRAVVPVFARQSRDYLYNLASCDFTLNLSQFQQVVVPQNNSKSAGSKSKVCNARLKLAIAGGKWAQSFSENRTLDIGKPAPWDSSVDQWFPSDTGGDGWREFMEALQKIEAVVQSSSAQR